MKKAAAFLLAVLMLTSSLAGCGNQEQTESTAEAEQPSSSGETVVLRMATGVPETVSTIDSFALAYTEEHPNITLEVTVLPGGVAGFNSAMASKLAANDAPDIFQYQWGSQITAYAKGGHLMDLTDSGIRETLREIKKPMNVYQGKDYAYPVYQSLWGLMYNSRLGEEVGVTEIPKTLDQFTELMDKMRENGIEYPFIVPGKDGSGATGFVFCYLHQIVSGQNPDFYYQCVTGEKSWDGEEWRNLFEVYDRLLNYTSPDVLGLDVDNALTRFAREEGAFMVSGPSTIKQLEEMNPELEGNLLYIPFPLYENEEDYATISDYDAALSIWSQTEHPEEALEMYKQFFTPENNVALAQTMNMVSSVAGTPDDYLDPSVVNQMPLLDAGKYVGFSEREWIPGIKEIMKTLVQEWIAGTDLDTTLANLEKEHQRLLDADPEFIEEFETLRENTIE